jgi:hypothetical protein
VNFDKEGMGVLFLVSILLKNPMNASTRLSMNGKSPMITPAPPFVLRFSKDERRVFQQNLVSTPVCQRLKLKIEKQT